MAECVGESLDSKPNRSVLHVGVASLLNWIEVVIDHAIEVARDYLSVGDANCEGCNAARKDWWVART